MKTLGIVLPMGQSKELLQKSGQWSLWEQEIAMYKKSFENVEIFEYRHHGIGRFVEALLMPMRERTRWMNCTIFKAVHLTGSVPCLIGRWMYEKSYVLSYGYRYDQFAALEWKWLQWLFVTILTPIAVRYADAVMVPTKELKEYVQGLGDRCIVIIPNGVDPTIFRGRSSQGRSSRGPSSRSNITILFVGRLEKQKNLEVLIKAIHLISKGLTFHAKGQTFKDIRLAFVGNGSLKNKLLALAKSLKLDLDIQNSIPNDQLPQIYQKADIFVFPSLIEGHPKVLLEAMSCGLPVIVSNIPGCRDIVTNGKDGMLVEPTIEGISMALCLLIKKPTLRMRMGENARKTIEKEFDKSMLIKREIELLQSFKKDRPRVREDNTYKTLR